MLEGLSCQTVSAGPAGPAFIAIPSAQDVFENDADEDINFIVFIFVLETKNIV